MQSRKDAALRAIVENTELPMRVRREALAEMEAPSRLFLTRLANDETTPAKLRLDAARRLPQAERRIADTRLKVDTPAKDTASKNIEAGITDSIGGGMKPGLSEEAWRLLYGPDWQAESGGSKTVSESGEPETPLPVPPGGVSSEPETGRPAEADRAESILPPEVAARREALLRRGRDLAKRILELQRLLPLAPHNKESGWLLDRLQAQWVAFESEARAAGVNIEAEFSQLALLRPYERQLSPAQYARERLLPTPWEAHLESVALAEAAKNPRRSNHDDSIWTGMPPGV